MTKRSIRHYDHPDKKRRNNPPVGLVTPETDPPVPTRKTYAYDPHLDPALQFDSAGAEVERIIEDGLAAQDLDAAKQALQDLRRRREPYLAWSGKAERMSFEVDTVSLHVHERIDPKTLIDFVRARNGDSHMEQLGLFDQPHENPPLRDAVDFYKHEHGWSNRLIAGDSLLVMNSLLEKEGLGEQVQMVYMDPPYGVEYASNFQPFVNNRTVKERDQDLTKEPEMIRAFRDTWSLGIHSYLTYLRDRALLARDLLAPSGSLFVQIGIDNVHLVRQLLDEVFGSSNFFSQIIFRKKMMPLSKKPGCESMTDHILWYVKSREEAEKKVRQLYVRKDVIGDDSWDQVQLADGTRRPMTADEIRGQTPLPEGARIYAAISNKPREYRQNQDFNFDHNGEPFPPPGGNLDRTPDGVHCWATTREGMERLRLARRLQRQGNTLRYVLFHDDYPVTRLTASWSDTAPPKGLRYVVETSPLVVQRCLLMATDPGDLVLDPTCGSGTTAYVAETWGRRWITCDTSRVALTLVQPGTWVTHLTGHMGDTWRATGEPREASLRAG